jgi:chromosome segregation ATPase
MQAISDEQQIDRLENKVDALDAKIEQKADDLDAKIDRLDANFERKFDRLDAKFEEKLGGLDAKIEEGLGGLDAKIENVRSEAHGDFRTLVGIQLTMLLAMILGFAGLLLQHL